MTLLIKTYYRKTQKTVLQFYIKTQSHKSRVTQKQKHKKASKIKCFGANFWKGKFADPTPWAEQAYC
jgi:hypothetical protein